MTTIVSLDVSRRAKELSELKQIQKYEMSFNQIENEKDNYNKSTSASKDNYMIEALNRVRQSDVTFNNDYTNMNGSGLFNPKVKPKQQMIKRKKVTKDSVSGLRQKPIETNKTKKRIEEEKIVPYDWSEMCKQLGKPRLREEVSYFGSLRRSLKTKRKGRLTYEY